MARSPRPAARTLSATGLSVLTLDQLRIDDEASFRPVGLYADLKEVLERAGTTFRVLPAASRGRWDRAVFLNLAFWGVDGGGDVLVDEHIAYVTSDASFHTPFARSYRVIEQLPYREKQLRAALRERDIGTLTIKKRGVSVDPDALRKRLALSGSETATVVLTRVGGHGRAYLVAPF